MQAAAPYPPVPGAELVLLSLLSCTVHVLVWGVPLDVDCMLCVKA